MPAREITGLNYLLPSDPCPYPSHYNMVQNTIPTFELHKLSNQFYEIYWGQCYVVETNE
ncbi:hypothetical protein JHK82_044548 [Glycine max]|nr:hypothetical protein JHK82_044548 [Glycine max]